MFWIMIIIIGFIASIIFATSTKNKTILSFGICCCIAFMPIANMGGMMTGQEYIRNHPEEIKPVVQIFPLIAFTDNPKVYLTMTEDYYFYRVKDNNDTIRQYGVNTHNLLIYKDISDEDQAYIKVTRYSYFGFWGFYDSINFSIHIPQESLITYNYNI